MEFNFKSYDNSKQSISYCEVDKCKAVIKLKEQLDKKEQECETLASQLDFEVQKKECLEQKCKNNEIAHQTELDIYNQEYLELQQELNQVLNELETYKSLAQQNGKVCTQRLDKIDELEHDYNDLLGECNHWKHQAELGVDTTNMLTKELAEKEKECENLKELIAKQKNAKIQLSKLKDKQYEEFCNMKQSLIKIKEIAKPYNDFSGNCVIVNSFKDMCDILKICDEVIK